MEEMKFTAETTERLDLVDSENKYLSFELAHNCMSIVLEDNRHKRIKYTEISRESAVKLAKYILFMEEQILPK